MIQRHQLKSTTRNQGNIRFTFTATAQLDVFLEDFERTGIGTKLELSRTAFDYLNDFRVAMEFLSLEAAACVG